MKGFVKISFAALFLCVSVSLTGSAGAQEAQVQAPQGQGEDVSKLKEDLATMQQSLIKMQQKIDQLQSSQAQSTEVRTMQQNQVMMQKRIDQLQSEQVKVQESVKEELAAATKEEPSKLSWHGYFAANYEDDTNAAANPAFDAFALALIPKFTLSDKIEVYSQLVFEHAPFHDINSSRDTDVRSAGEIVLNDTYLTYAVTDWLKFRGGKFATPFGFWNTLQYAAPTYITIKQPGRDSLYQRGSTPDTDANLYGRYTQGVWLLGEYDKFTYDFYVGNGKSSVRPHLDDNVDKAFGGRLGVNLNISESTLKLMYSRYQDRFKVATITVNTSHTPVISPAYTKQYTDALSAELNYHDLGIMSEFAAGTRGGTNINAFYIMAKYNLGEKWIPFVQYQLYEPNVKVSEDRINYYTLGTAYQILPWQTMLKLQVDYVKPESLNGTSLTRQTADYYRLMVGLAASF